MSSAMYALDMDDGRELVLRCYVRADLNEEEPDLVEREVGALAVAATADLPTPLLIAADLSGATAGVPAVLMTRLPGWVVWDPKNTRSWLTGLADALPAIHETEVVGSAGLGQYFGYQQESYEPPKWAVTPRVWEQAIELFHGPVLEEERCFIHRDFHPGNVLWVRGRVTGVVDWQSACTGPPSMDISHCRANLLGYAPELADQYRDLAERSLGRQFNPWADIAALIGMLDGLRTNPPRPAGRVAIERAVAQAVASLGRT